MILQCIVSAPRACRNPTRRVLSQRQLSASATTSLQHRRHLIFGANTDVGKTIVSAGLVRASRLDTTNGESTIVQYVKPMQCGGSDERFVKNVLELPSATTSNLHPYQANTLFDWETAASPHTASRHEGLPMSDAQVLQALRNKHEELIVKSPSTVSWYETAGGVLSPGAASPDNDAPWYARQADAPSSSPMSWGWQPQADLYRPLAPLTTSVLVGDARLGGISATLSSLESLLWRGYRIPALVVIQPASGDCDVHANARALKEYTNGRWQESNQHNNMLVVELPAIPPDPAVPLDDWYQSTQVQEAFAQLNEHLENDWKSYVLEMAAAETQASALPEAGLALRLARRFSQDGPVALRSKNAKARLSKQVLALDENIEWATATQEWVHQTPAAVTRARNWARKYALATYQKRMRVTSEQKESMEWAICYHTVPDIQETEDDSLEDSSGEEEEEGEDDFTWVSAENLILDAPTLAYADGKLRIRFPEGLEASPDTVTEFESIDKALDIVTRRISPKLYSQYKELIEMQWLVYEHTGINRKIGAILIEPLLSRDNAWVDPLWQRALIEIGEARNIPIIFDETRLGTGIPKGSQCLNVEPDIAILGNFPSASELPIMTTAYTEEVAAIVEADDSDEEDSFLETEADGMDYAFAGHQLYLQNLSKATRSPKLNFPEAAVRSLSKLEKVGECFALGDVLSIHLKSDNDGNTAAQRIITKLADFRVSINADGSRIITTAPSHLGREERQNIVDVIISELK